MDTELSDGTVLLRPFRAEDIDAVYEAVRESIREISVWMPWCHEGYKKEETIAFIMSRDEAVKNETEYSFAVIDPQTDTILGGVGINRISRDYGFANLGYWVRTSKTGLGIASRAARLGALFGLEQLKLQRIEIIAAVDNLASQRAAEKAGALREGVLRKRLVIHGRTHNAVMFSLVAEDLSTDSADFNII